jgi:predicted O-methyltransferase YrrM
LDIDHIHQLAGSIEGWLTSAEGEMLFNFAMNLPEGNIVEIGSWKGKSTFYFACGLVKRGKGYIYSVDHHTGSIEQQKRIKEPINTLNEFTENMRIRNVGHIIKPLVMDSITASKNLNDDIGLIFIDGSHDYESVRSDFEAWWPKLQVGGIIAFHDYISKDGVASFVDEIMHMRNDLESPNITHEIISFRKSTDSSVISKSEIEEIKNYKMAILDELKKGDENTRFH